MNEPTDTELLDWLQSNGASLLRNQQPDMGGYDWFVNHPAIASSKRFHTKGRSVRQAVINAMAAIRQMEGQG
jgi:hypothetical protein